MDRWNIQALESHFHFSSSLSEYFVHFAEVIGSPSSLIFLHNICTRFFSCKNLGRLTQVIPKTTFPDFGQLEYSHNLDAFSPLCFCTNNWVAASSLPFLLRHLHNLYIWPELTHMTIVCRNINWVTKSSPVCTIFTFGRN